MNKINPNNPPLFKYKLLIISYFFCLDMIVKPFQGNP